jgi:hypothetical protein
MSVDYNAKGAVTDLVTNIGEAAAHTLFPLDLDTYYAMSLQLVNHDNDTIDYFVFPVMPQNYQSNYRSLTYVRKTAGGVLATKAQGFTPRQITITGNFGKNFRVMVGQTHVSAKSWKISTAGGDYTGGLLQIKAKPFMVVIKNGYGATKILEAICFKASQLDEKGYPYTLFFYNPTFGESYVVSVDSFNITQSVQQTGLWAYSLQMTALNFIGTRHRALRLIGADTISKGLTGIVSAVRESILT